MGISVIYRDREQGRDSLLHSSRCFRAVSETPLVLCAAPQILLVPLLQSSLFTWQLHSLSLARSTLWSFSDILELLSQE